MNNFFKVPKMSQNRLNWVGIDLTSVPAKFGGPGSSRTVTITVPNLAPKSRILWSKVGTKMEPSPCDGSRRARAFKLCRDTCQIYTNPINRFWNILGSLRKTVHFCSFRSFWESGASFRSTKRQFLFTFFIEIFQISQLHTNLHNR